MSAAPGVLALAAGVLGTLAAAELAEAARHAARGRAPGVTAAVTGAVDALLRLGREGREPGALERRRLLLGGAVAGAAAGALVLGPVPGILLGAAGPAVVARVLRARREAYARAVDAGAAGVAVAIAAAIGGGHSVRGALTEASRRAAGPAGHELRRVAAELAAGARTDAALEALRDRTRSERIGVVVAACLLQRRAGGDLARLLRDCAAGLRGRRAAAGEVRAATAQARFTGLVVVLLPLGGGVLAELASPGLVGGLLRSWS